MKKISLKLIADDKLGKQDINALKGVREINDYMETQIKHEDFMAGYSFDSLLDSGKTVVQGIVWVVRGSVGMTVWAAAIIVSSLKWLWKDAFKKKGMEKKDDVDKGKSKD